MKRFTTLVTGAVVAASMMLGTAAAANPANFYLSSGSAPVGGTFNVAISEDGDNVNVVTAKLTYDTSRLQLLSVSCTSSLSNAQTEANGVTCYGAGGTSISGTQQVASASFKAVSAGSATISIASNSLIASNGADVWNHSLASTNTTVSVAPATLPASPVVGAPASNKPSTGSSSKPTTGTNTSTTGNKGTSTTSQPASKDTKKAQAQAKKEAAAAKKKQINSRRASEDHSDATMYVLLAILIGVVTGVVLPLVRRKQAAAAAPIKYTAKTQTKSKAKAKSPAKKSRKTKA